MASANELRERFKALPLQVRQANQSFSIRVWRALSWLERAEGLDRDDYEGRFISAWIGFNALYGRLDEQGQPWGEREAWEAFVAAIWKLDHDGRMRRVLFKRELQVLKLIESKYLTPAFWEEGESAVVQVKRELKQEMAKFGTRRTLLVLLNRLYTMRVQVFHGASTKGSKLNRRTLQGSAVILLDVLPEMLSIMIEYGTKEDWGSVCFPPS